MLMLKFNTLDELEDLISKFHIYKDVDKIKDIHRIPVISSRKKSFVSEERKEAKKIYMKKYRDSKKSLKNLT